MKTDEEIQNLCEILGPPRPILIRQYLQVVFQGMAVFQLLYARQVIACHDRQNVTSPKFHEEAAVYFTFDGRVEFVFKNLGEDRNQLQVFGSPLADGVQVTPTRYTLQQQDLGLRGHLVIFQQVSCFFHVLGCEFPSSRSSWKTSVCISEASGVSRS